MTALLDLIFGCSHRRYSFPLTVRRHAPPAARKTGTYVTCLDCGREFAYDWQRMRRVS